MPPLIILFIFYLIPFLGDPVAEPPVPALFAEFLPPLLNPVSVLLANTLTDCPALSGISLPSAAAMCPPTQLIT